MVYTSGFFSLTQVTISGLANLIVINLRALAPSLPWLLLLTFIIVSHAAGVWSFCSLHASLCYRMGLFRFCSTRLWIYGEYIDGQA